jgi:hypothetical protein
LWNLPASKLILSIISKRLFDLRIGVHDKWAVPGPRGSHLAND